MKKACRNEDVRSHNVEWIYAIPMSYFLTDTGRHKREAAENVSVR